MANDSDSSEVDGENQDVKLNNIFYRYRAANRWINELKFRIQHGDAKK
jgi:ABC-type bacteriocin/lantibiotic exporter with double-glycine peptidase domain